MQQGTINKTAFAKCYKEWKFCQVEMENMQMKSLFECRSCSIEQYACHVDGNCKLYRYKGSGQYVLLFCLSRTTFSSWNSCTRLNTWEDGRDFTFTLTKLPLCFMSPIYLFNCKTYVSYLQSSLSWMSRCLLLLFLMFVSFYLPMNIFNYQITNICLNITKEKTTILLWGSIFLWW